MNGSMAPSAPPWAKWLIGVLTTMLVGAAGFHANAVISHGQRIAVLESELHNVSRKMDSIEAKLDRLLLK